MVFFLSHTRVGVGINLFSSAVLSLLNYNIISLYVVSSLSRGTISLSSSLLASLAAGVCWRLDADMAAVSSRSSPLKEKTVRKSSPSMRATTAPRRWISSEDDSVMRTPHASEAYVSGTSLLLLPRTSPPFARTPSSASSPSRQYTPSTTSRACATSPRCSLPEDTFSSATMASPT